jgi:hypothetical protein
VACAESAIVNLATVMVLDPCVDGSIVFDTFEAAYAPPNFALIAQIGKEDTLDLEGVGMEALSWPWVPNTSNVSPEADVCGDVTYTVVYESNQGSNPPHTTFEKDPSTGNVDGMLKLAPVGVSASDTELRLVATLDSYPLIKASVPFKVQI